MQKALFLLYLLVFSSVICRAQSPEIGHLRASLPHIKDSTQYVDALNRLAMLLYEKSIDSTFTYAKQARAIADRIDYAKGRADALNNLGVVYDIKGDLQFALRYYDEGFIGYSNLRDSANCVQALMNIAMVYKELGKDDRSIQRFNMALANGKKLRQDSITSLVIYNYLLAFPNRFTRDAKRSYIDKAKSISTRYKDQRVLVALDQLVADDLIDHGQREAGLKLLDGTINKALDKKLFYVSMDMIIDMGDRLAEKDPTKAAAYYQQGLTTALNNQYLYYSRSMARKLFDLYYDRKDSLTAVRYSRKLIELHDEQEKMDNGSSIDYLDYALKDDQVRSLTLRSKYQIALLSLAVVACLLAIVIIVVIRGNLARTRRLNEQVTDRNHQLEKTLNALEQSQADNTRMMQIVAHDLRNPVGAMSSIAKLMLDDPDRSENDHMLLELIRTSGNNSLELISDLLQVQFNVEDLKKELVHIGEMLSYCVSLLNDKAEVKGQTIELQTLDIALQVSREKLWRVISNLIANAIKFSPTGATINVDMNYYQDKLRIAVRDHGIGIPQELGDKIFDMFTEAKRPGTAGEQPFGLGLAISKQIVEAHNGNIWFESDQGIGTTFYVDLPV